MSDNMFAGRRILVIDDDPAVRSVIQQHFELRKATISLAETAHDGIETALGDSIDLIILDVMLPDLEGFEVCKTLKADERTQHIPVMFLTACEQTKERVKGLRAGAIDYLVKPFDLEELALRADIALRIKSERLEPPVGNPSPTAPDPGPIRNEAPEEDLSLPTDVLPREEFIQIIQRRFEALDPSSGLLSLVLIRPDQEAYLGSEDHAHIRQVFVDAVLEILREVAPKGSVVGLLDPMQVGLLIPRKNKYVAELILDELRNLLAMRSFHNGDEEHHLTLSCGVSEFPNPQIESVKQFEEKAEFAVRRAQRLGGDQTILM